MLTNVACGHDGQQSVFCTLCGEKVGPRFSDTWSFNISKAGWWGFLLGASMGAILFGLADTWALLGGAPFAESTVAKANALTVPVWLSMGLWGVNRATMGLWRRYFYSIQRIRGIAKVSLSAVGYVPFCGVGWVAVDVASSAELRMVAGWIAFWGLIGIMGTLATRRASTAWAERNNAIL